MPLRVLLVDPDDHDRALAAAIVARELPEASIVQIGSGAALGAALARAEIDVAVCELENGWTNGVDLIDGIRSAVPTVAIVVLTRSDVVGSAVAAFKAGANEFLVKSSRAYLELPAAVSTAHQAARLAECSRRSETRLQRLLDRSRVGVFRASLEGELLEASPALLSLLGVGTLQEAVELELPALYFSSRRRGELLGRLDDCGELREREVELRRADGMRLWVNLTEVLLVDADGDVVIDGLVEDVSGLRRRLETAEGRGRELQGAVEDLQEFTATVCHELQQPLRMMERYTQMLQEQYAGRLDADADEYIGFAVEGARTMQQIIDDLLSLTKVSSGERSSTACDCDALLDRAIRASWQQIEESGARIHRQPLPKVLGDGPHIVQLFLNLLANAMKFRGEEAPEIRISVEKEDDLWVFSVLDNGIGIPADQRDRVFEVFTRLHPEIEGSGVGLALCRRIVERHGGRIWAEEAPSGGTAIRFTLPRRSDVEGAALGDTPTVASHGD